MHQFQKLIGFINFTLIKGRASEFICDNLQKLNVLSGLVEKSNLGDYVTDLLVVDREEDYISLFLSQLNYSGILDETFPIKCGIDKIDSPSVFDLSFLFSLGKIELDAELVKESSQTAKHNLFCSDTIFSDVQDMSFSSVCLSLKEKGQKLRQKYSERQSMSLSEMKEFLSSELRNIRSEHQTLFLRKFSCLSFQQNKIFNYFLDINICESIMKKKKSHRFADQLRVERNLIEGIENRASLNFIENGIIKLYPKDLMLRLICLYCICHSGISHKELHSLIRYYTQSYGYESIITFCNLKKLGIVFESSNQFNFVTPNSAQKLLAYQSSISTSTVSSSESIKKFRHIIKKFNLIPLIENESYNIRNPTDCGYVFAGAYFPFICKLVQSFIDLKSSTQIDEWCKHTQCKLQPSVIPTQHSNRDSQLKTKRIQIILFVGGVTYAEVSAIRFLSKQKGIPILILTTSVTNGNTFLESLQAKSF